MIGHPLIPILTYFSLPGIQILVYKYANGTPLQYSCLENPMDQGAWGATVHGVMKSQTRLSDFTFTFHFHALEKAMATHSSTLAWKIPWTKEPGRLKESDTTERLHFPSLPFPSPGDLPNPGMEPRSPALQADSLLAEPQGKPNHAREKGDVFRPPTTTCIARCA